MKRPLDRIDRAILAALQNDGRLSNKELAAKVGLAPSSCLERVRRLRADGILRGFHADVDPSALGIGLQAIVAVRLRMHSQDFTSRFRVYATEVTEVVSLYRVGGADDFLAHVVVRDTDHLRDVVDRFAAREEVAHLHTMLVFSHDRSAMPFYGDRDR